MRKPMRLLVAIGLVTVGVLTGLFLANSPETDNLRLSPRSLVFGPPAFAQSASRSFLEEEAGISLHVTVEQTIELERARRLFEVLEDQTDSYLIGTVELPDHDRTFWPHVWVHRDGWIVVYYNKAEPTSRLMHWPTYTGEPPRTTTLREVLLIVGREVRADTGQIEEDMRYYHWQHPDATRLLMVAGTGTFRYTLPHELTILDASASHRGRDIDSVNRNNEWSRTRIDDQELIRGGANTYILTKELASMHLTADTPHSVTVESGSGSADVALFFLYR